MAEPKTDKQMWQELVQEAMDDALHGPMGSYCFREEPCPYFQVERHPDDDLFLQRLDKDVVPWSRHHRFPDTAIEKLAKDELLLLLCTPMCESFWETFKKMSEHAGDNTFYHSAIRATATLVQMLYPKEYLFDCGHSRMLDNQLSQLWEEEFAIMGRKKRPVSEVYESIVRDKIIDKKKYYLVKECDVVGMISRYSTALEHPCIFERRYKESYRGKLKNPCFGDLKEVIDKMEPSPRLKVDDYTRLLIKFARRDPVKYKEMLLTRVVEIVDTKALRRLNPYLLIFWHEEEPTFKDIDLALTHLMLNFFDAMKNELQEQLLTVVRPLLRLSDFLDLSASLYVFEIVEVAELRRCALGDRFISRNHLMWAFYECGYGLPPRITKTLNLNTADEDHPPYHIYWSSLKLAKSLGEKNMRLQHFVFAVLYSEDIFIDDKQVIEMQEHFKDFLKVVASDSLERPKVPCNSSEISYFKLLGHDMLISSEELKNALQSGKLDELVRECSLMMIS